MHLNVCEKALIEYCFTLEFFTDVHVACQNTMATKMKLKLKTVFVLYFMVSLLGLLYALMQLGKLSLPRSNFGRKAEKRAFMAGVMSEGVVAMFAGQRCDCTEHDLPKDRTISWLRGELNRLQEQMKKSEETRQQPQKQASETPTPTIFVITPTYARSLLKQTSERLLPPLFSLHSVFLRPGWCRRPN